MVVWRQQLARLACYTRLLYHTFPPHPSRSRTLKCMILFVEVMNASSDTLVACHGRSAVKIPWQCLSPHPCTMVLAVRPSTSPRILQVSAVASGSPCRRGDALILQCPLDVALHLLLPRSEFAVLDSDGILCVPCAALRCVAPRSTYVHYCRYRMCLALGSFHVYRG